MVVVHIEAPQAVDLEVLDADGSWERRCTSPCNRPVPAGQAYRVTGSGIRDSKAFELDAGNRASLQVEPTSSAGRAGAVVITVVGAAGLGPGAVVTSLIVGGEVIGAILICPFVAAFETVKSQQGPMYGNCLGDIATYLAAGYVQPWVWIPALGGVVLLTGGIVWLTKTPATAVTQSVGAPAAAVVRPLAPELALAGARLPAPLVFPVIDGHF